MFAATIAKLEPVIAAESGFSVTEAITAQQTVTGIDKVQPAVFAVQVALAATMEQTYGVRPGAVVGHSMGESPRPSSRGHCRSRTRRASFAAARS